eukprot:scaffold20443_cov146-Isochrysis_galbana.AAC.3
MSVHAGSAALPLCMAIMPALAQLWKPKRLAFVGGRASKMSPRRSEACGDVGCAPATRHRTPLEISSHDYAQG